MIKRSRCVTANSYGQLFFGDKEPARQKVLCRRSAAADGELQCDLRCPYAIAGKPELGEVGVVYIGCGAETMTIVATEKFDVPEEFLQH